MIVLVRVIVLEHTVGRMCRVCGEGEPMGRNHSDWRPQVSGCEICLPLIDLISHLSPNHTKGDQERQLSGGRRDERREPQAHTQEDQQARVRQQRTATNSE